MKCIRTIFNQGYLNIRHLYLHISCLTQRLETHTTPGAMIVEINLKRFPYRGAATGVQAEYLGRVL